MSDNVNHPAHYNMGSIEVIDYLDDYDFDFCLGNTMKYILRAGYKESYTTDLEKAAWYLEHYIGLVRSGQKISPCDIFNAPKPRKYTIDDLIVGFNLSANSFKAFMVACMHSYCSSNYNLDWLDLMLKAIRREISDLSRKA